MAATRRPIVLAAAVAGALTLGATALVMPAVAAPAAPGAPAVGLKDGTLDWGVKESFRKYLLSPIANGSITVADGAEQAEDNGPFTFTGGTGSYDTGTHAVSTAFRGSVHFEGHEGVLDIELSDLKVATSGTTGAITADVTTVTDGTAATDDDVALAGLDLTGIAPGQGDGGAMVFKDIPAKLTAAGADAFQGFYQEGTQLDPATLTVTADPGGSGDPSGEPTSPSDDPGTDPSGGSDDPGTGPSDDPGQGGEPAASTSPGDAAGTDDAGQVTDGTLSWGLKKSFRGYIASGGDITLAGGAKDNGDGFDFPYAKGEVDSDAKKLTASFDGSARFGYPAHGIDMKFSDLKIEASGAKGTLLVDVTTPDGTHDDVDFADLDLSKASYLPQDDVVLLDGIPAELTADGAAQFANDTTGTPYPAGTALDPVTVALALSDDAVLPGGSGGSASDGSASDGGTAGGATAGGGTVGGAGALASTGSAVPLGTLITGAGVAAAAGAAVVLSARRRGTGDAV